MERSIKDAMLEWMPGVVAGLLPLFMFCMVSIFKDSSTAAAFQENDAHFRSGLISHFLVIGIVNSTVSLASFVTRIQSGSLPNALQDGRGPGLLVLLTTGIVLYLATLYAITEQGNFKVPMLSMTLAGLLASLLASLYLEFAVARLRTLLAVRVEGTLG